MTRGWRAVARWVAVGGLAVLLSGCMKLDMDLQVNADDTVSGKVIFALDKQLLELTGQSAEEVLGTDAPVPTDAEGVSAEPYEDDEFAGQRFSFDAVPLSRFNESEDPDALQIVREGDVFRVSGALDLSGATGATGVPGFEDAFQGAELRIRISFPGEVTESNGRVEGNTVTWEPKVGERLEIRATASAIGGAGGGSNLALIPILVGAVAVLAIAIAVVASRRRGGAPTATAGEPGAEAASPIPSTAPPEGGVAPTPAPGGEATPVGGDMPPTAPPGEDLTPPTTPARGDLTPPAPPPTGDLEPRPVTSEEEEPGREPPAAPPSQG